MVRIMMSMMGVMVWSWMIWVMVGNVFGLVSVICTMREIGFAPRVFRMSRRTISGFGWAIARLRGMVGLRLMVCRFGRSIRFRCMIWLWFVISRGRSMVRFRMDRGNIGCRSMIGFRFDGRNIGGRSMVGFRLNRGNIGGRSMVRFRGMVRFGFDWRDIGWDGSMIGFNFGYWRSIGFGLVK